MLAERFVSTAVREMSKSFLKIAPTTDTHMPPPENNQKYMLYIHVPFCTKLCPYCSFNRFPFSEDRAIPYFEALRHEMCMLADLKYDFESVYIGGGTPTVMIDELCETIDQARDLFNIREVSCETNPNHLIPETIEKLVGRVQRLSVGVQSLDDGLLKQMQRYDKYGCSDEIIERIQFATPFFQSMNADMIFNFPAQTEDMLFHDIERIVESGCSQVTFYPLMASSAVKRSLAHTIGKVDYRREQHFYKIIDELLTGGDNPLFTHSSAWTFNRTNCTERVCSECSKEDTMIDEYVVQYEEYPAIGSGSITYLNNTLYVNTFSLREYSQSIAAGRMSIMGRTDFNLHDCMRYRFLMQLFGLRLDKQQWEHDFELTVENSLPVEMAFMKLVGAFATNTPLELTLTPKGRYLVLAMMRQFFIGVNNLRDQARAVLPDEERKLLFQ